MENPQPTTGAQNIPAAGEANHQTGADTPAGIAGNSAQSSPDSSQDGAPKTVPLSVVQSVREELKSARDQAALYRRQLELTRQGAAKKPDPLDGMAEDAPLTVGQAKKAMQGQARQMEALASQLSFAMANPGFAQTIKEHLPQVLKNNPGLMDVIRYSGNPLATAYSIARLSPSARNAGQGDVASQMQKILANSEKPGSASAAAGGTGISAANRIAKMNGAEFSAYKEQVKAGKIKIGG
ncbi:MAG: hypothetical protein JEZ02_00145 [Desulfatibacillum sp.]|nr:hypothetical protein [Desulfatibacillum sp.]